MRSMQLGTYDYNVRTVLEMFTGYIQIQEKGFSDNPTLRKTFNYDNSIINLILQQPEIEGFAPRILADGLIGNRYNSTGVAIIAIKPDLEISTTNLLAKVNKGRQLKNNQQGEILVGYKLLENLNTAIGDDLIILASGYDGTMGNMKFKIAGTIKLGNPEFDAMSVVMNLEDANELLSLGGRISTIAVRLGHTKQIPLVKNNLNKRFSNLNYNNLVTLDWMEVLPDLKQSIELDNISGLIYMFFLIIIVAFGILNTVIMSITERFKEFGVVLALGAKQTNLIVIVFFEVMFLTLIGIVNGNVIGIALNYYFYINPIYFGGEFAELYEQYGWEPALFFSMAPNLYINSSLIIIIISLIVYIYPAYKLYQLEPLRGIRYT
jgi:ABC-type lipoprotein release transport system permease subunit